MMKRDEEERYPMEIRVVVQLPGDKHDEFENLKRKRGLTDHIQTIIDESDGSGTSHVQVNSGDYSDGRIDRLEDGMSGMTELLATIFKNSESERIERQNQLSLMQEQMRIQNEVLQKLTGELGNLVNREVAVPTPVPVEQVVPQMGMTPEMMKEMMATMMAGMQVPTAVPVAPVEAVEVEKGEMIVKKPKKNKRISAMMDI